MGALIEFALEDLEAGANILLVLSNSIKILAGKLTALPGGKLFE